MSTWNHASNKKFYDYYAKASQSQETLQRFGAIHDTILRVLEREGSHGRSLEVADIGCGAGTQSLLWAELGHQVHGVDINEDLVTLARQRTAATSYILDLRVGSATELPWTDESMDVCLIPELLEHVVDWRTCLNECARILRPGGLLFLATTNKLCPIQQEFALPLYSWYPALLKRHIEHLAATSHPHLANFATYPAVNWFSFLSLDAVLTTLGFRSMDRFDIMDISTKRAATRIIISGIRSVPILRWLAQVFTPSTIIVAIKENEQR